MHCNHYAEWLHIYIYTLVISEIIVKNFPINIYIILICTQVCACSDFTKKCGNWSLEMQAATLDGIPGRPSNVTVTCSTSWMNLTWQPPVKPNAEIKGYTVRKIFFLTLIMASILNPIPYNAIESQNHNRSMQVCHLKCETNSNHWMNN